MFSYNLQLALKSLKERPVLTSLIILVIAIGLGLYTTVQTMAYQQAKIPLPHKSQNIHLVQMDNREITAEEQEQFFRMVDTTYRDAIALHAMDLPAKLQTFNWSTFGVLNVEDENILPIRMGGAVTTSEFFQMLEVPFLFGSGWDANADTNGENVIVISRTLNDKLFGGVNSVGQTMRIGTDVLKVVGVIGEWYLPRRFYDRSYRSANPDDYFVPATYAINNNLPRSAFFECWKANESMARSFRTENKEQMMASECAWITYWAEIEDGQVDEYENSLMRYMDDQKLLGRFPRENKIFVTNIDEQLEAVNSRNGFINMFKNISYMFFAVCLLNAIGILLAKFMRRSKEVSLRRALGAKKRTIIFQHLIEVIIIGLIGGVVGLVVAFFGLEGMLAIRMYSSDYQLRLEDMEPYFRLDTYMIFKAFITSIVCTIVISLYPIWRLCNTPPASQLKSQ